MLATITIQPHLGKNKKMTPEKLLPFPWDKPQKRKAKDKGKQLTPDQQRKRMADIVKKLGDTI